MHKVLTALLLAIACTATFAQQAEGEIRKVDRSARKITLKHGEIKSIDMPPMTMVYGVRDAKLLEGLKPGDKVLFDAEKAGADYVITTIEVRK